MAQLREMKLKEAAKKVEDGAEGTLTAKAATVNPRKRAPLKPCGSRGLSCVDKKDVYPP